jgi:hypothetical protein
MLFCRFWSHGTNNHQSRFLSTHAQAALSLTVYVYVSWACVALIYVYMQSEFCAALLSIEDIARSENMHIKHMTDNGGWTSLELCMKTATNRKKKRCCCC